MSIGRTIILRRFRQGDEATLVKWFQNLELLMYYDHLPPPTYSQIVSKLKQRLNTNHRLDLIIENKKGEPVGTVYLKKIDWKNRHAELHILIAEKKDQGRLYGAEAAFLLLRHAFRELNLNKIYCRTIEYAEEVQRLIHLCGFKKEAVCRNLIYQQGKYWDVNIYGMLKNEFEKFVTQDGRRFAAMAQ